jgi:hypothetical protein
VKSSLIPSTDFPFLDFQWNMVQASIAIPQVNPFHSQASILSNLTSPSCRQILVLTGLIAAFFKAVCLKGRWLQISLKLSVLFGDGFSEDSDPQSPGKERPQLDPQFHPTPVLCPIVESVSRSLRPQGPDGRKIGYGIWFQGSLHQGHLDSTTTHLHINVLESIVLWTFMYCILPQSLSQRNILWRIDNTTALAYIKKEGGTCSPQVLEIAEKILIKAHQMSVHILPVFIPTGENIQAGAASRFQQIPDWHLHSSVFRAILARWGPPSIDLFASRASKQTHRFFSWDAADNLEAVDALSQKWDFILAYAFPPICLLTRVVKKLEMLRGSFILISPLWEAQTWLASLLSLTVLEICQLPFIDNLVTDMTTGKPPQILHNLHCRLEDFRRLHSLQDLPIDTRDLHEAGWCTSTESRYEAAWKSFKRHLRSTNVSLY